MNEERTGKYLRQVEHIRGHLWHIKFHNGQTSQGDDRKTSNWWLQLNQEVTLGSVASLLAATLYQGHLDRNHKF
jgi:hypothetical protein